MKRAEPNRQANIWTARFVPLFLLGIIGYSSWVITKLICIDYLLDPPQPLLLSRRTGAATAVLVIYYILLFILLVCYARLVQTVIVNPGLVPYGPQWYVEQERKSKEEGSKKRRTIHKELDTDSESYTNRKVENGQAYDDFWQKDVFVCAYDGRPRFCSTCYNIKPDRAHHCSELDRCVLKMDHFCPWVGGIVSETSFKYFVQFTFWAALYTLHILVFTAYFFAERRRREDYINAHWILVLAFAALFCFFSGGMFGSSLQFVLENTTTIENLSKRSHVHYLAVYIPQKTYERVHTRTDLRMITYPRPPSEQLQLLQFHGANVAENQVNSTFPPHPALSPPSSSHGNPPMPNKPPPMTRTFAILETKPGENPFNVGFFNNFREVMGFTLLDWLFPIRPSPLVDHDAPESMYRMGPVVDRLRREAGILDEESSSRKSSSHRRKRRRRRHRVDQPELKPPTL